MEKTPIKSKIGAVGFGQINHYPPAHWRYDGTRGGAHVLANVKPASQSTAYPDQFVTLEAVLRILSDD